MKTSNSLQFTWYTLERKLLDSAIDWNHGDRWLLKQATSEKLQELQASTNIKSMEIRQS